MSRLKRLIAWIDRDIGADTGMPDTHSLSSVLMAGPLLLAGTLVIYFDPPAQVRYWAVGITAVPTAFLVTLWGWRVLRAALRHGRKDSR